MQLTQDHAFEEHFQRSRLTRAIGLDDAVRVDYAQGDVRAGDVFVLTSDDVHGAVGRAELLALAGSGDATAARRALVAAAVKAGTPDKATALVVRVRQTDPARLRTWCCSAATCRRSAGCRWARRSTASRSRPCWPTPACTACSRATSGAPLRPAKRG